MLAKKNQIFLGIIFSSIRARTGGGGGRGSRVLGNVSKKQNSPLGATAQKREFVIYSAHFCGLCEELVVIAELSLLIALHNPD